MQMVKVYLSDPLAELLALLGTPADKELREAADRVAYQHYGAPISLVQRAYRIVAGWLPLKVA